MTVNVSELLALPQGERAELASILVESLEPDQELSEEHLAELRRLVAAYQENPADTYSLEEVEASVFADD